MEFKNNIIEQIGNTPLIRLNKINSGLKPQIFAKLESANPGGSLKDRIGFAMIQDAVDSGKLKPGGTVIEATSGNTGIGLAISAAVLGFKSICVVTDKVSIEKIDYLKAFGTEVVVCSNTVKHDSPDYYITVARKIEEETPNSIFLYQYSNQSNPRIHYNTTGPEIWRQTDGKITHFVTGIGTGGCISGVGKFLKEKNPNIKIIAADPVGSILKEFKEGKTIGEGTPYLVEGIGQDCIPQVIAFDVIDEFRSSNDFDSFNCARALTRQEGIFCGGSTGTILKVVLEIAAELDENAVIVFIVCDTGERYLSKFHKEEWLRENRLMKKEIRTLSDITNSKKLRSGNSEIVFVNSNEKVRKVVELFDTKGFSQVPVIEDYKSVGSIREARVMSKLLEDQSLLDAPVSKIMDASFPCLESRTELQAAKKYLTESPAILVLEYGRIIDIITRYDIIEFSEL